MISKLLDSPTAQQSEGTLAKHIQLHSRVSIPNHLSLYLYILDSGGRSYPEILSKAEVKWFRSKSRETNPDLSAPELIFWHISQAKHTRRWLHFQYPEHPGYGGYGNRPRGARMVEMYQKPFSIKFVDTDGGWRCA
ncbi:hypothetical protein MLD38_028808 [Melastoma candidum]|uniref:Uncharacterized protein n=1 Tax=Melastoma candidum TaxID=119954 RepID=A0ACB9N6E5_9MYRT|nr:hypothetical protein MLD38_028808 [Melastoma candidum]